MRREVEKIQRYKGISKKNDIIHMMKVPYANLAYVPRNIAKDKIENYLLSLTNPYSKSRALFFRSKGFNETNMNLFEKRLLEIIHSNNTSDEEQSAYGRKYIVDGTIQTPCGEDITLRTVWIVEIGRRKPVFVTAYPNNV